MSQPAFGSVVDVLRRRIGDADALDSAELHSFRALLADLAARIPDAWYWEAFDELEAQGHLALTSRRLNDGDACGRLSAEGRWFLRAIASDRVQNG